MDVPERAAAVREHLSGALAGSGVEVEDVAILPAGKRRLVRVTVARELSGLPEGDDSSTVEPLSLDEVSEATRLVGAAMDDADLMGEAAYTLEVSSPGVGQPLHRWPQFRRNVGRLLRVTLVGGTEHEARLTAAPPEAVRLDPPLPEGPDPVPLDHIARAAVQVEFTRPSRKER